MRVFRLRNFLTLSTVVVIVLLFDWYIHHLPDRRRKANLARMRQQRFDEMVEMDNIEADDGGIDQQQQHHFLVLDQRTATKISIAAVDSTPSSTTILLMILLKNSTTSTITTATTSTLSTGSRTSFTTSFNSTPSPSSTLAAIITSTVSASSSSPSPSSVSPSTLPMSSTLSTTTMQTAPPTTRSLTKRRTLRQMCPDPAPGLMGQLNVSLVGPPMENITQANPSVQLGGIYRPPDCISLHPRVAIVVPYRDREPHLRAFLHHMHPILQRQQLNYAIIVVEQAGNGTFNKALLMNAAYFESLQMADPNDIDSQFQCFIFHDIDLLSEDDRGLYTCRDKPTHFSEYLSHLNYEPYKYIDVLFGGVVAIPRRHFELVNGYSNVYFGWGAEDEDIRRRFRYARIPIIKVEREKYRYKMFTHGPDRGNPRNRQRVALLRNATIRMHQDGLNTLSYNLLKSEALPMYTHLLIDFNPQDFKT